MKKYLFIINLFALLLSPVAYSADEGFPGRSEYPDIPIYEKEALYRDFNKVYIIDARSNYEFETLHINGAGNIPVSSKTFEEQIKAISAKTNKPIVFYCNGRTCYKSYKAVKIAIDLNIDNVYAYDAGMFEWATSYPDLATLLGKSPMDPKDILSKKTFKSRMLAPQKFKDTAFNLADKAYILDIRDLYQRAASIGYFTGREHWISLNRKKKVIDFIKKAKQENKTLFIYDEVGKQVRWLQYTLEQEQVKNYYFMEKGARGYYKNIIQKSYSRPSRPS